MWVHRVGAQQAKAMLFTGSLISGIEAARIGLALTAVPDDALDETVHKLCKQIAAVPKNQLMMTKMISNNALENQGLHSSQVLATLFDGIARHSPEGMWFKEIAEKQGFATAVKARDGGQQIAKGVSRPSFRTSKY
eukprot:c6188_g1_i2.p2 GENE.c6188_g1_i2~~c6188_g1_i2.p2  ORF type:complete len:136 (+),score=39.68 c6188_g1_i2:578-985(+)